MDPLRVAAALEPAHAERHRRERNREQLGERGRSQRPVRADRDVERVVVGRKLGSLECDLDQTLALLLCPEDLEEDRRWAGAQARDLVQGCSKFATRL